MFTLRPATPKDAVPILTLLGGVWDGDEEAVAYHGGGRTPGVIALEEGRLVGYASLRRGTLHPTHLYVGVHVHPDARRRGVGAALWEAVTAGVSGSLKTATSAHHPEALRFLERRGLRVSVRTHQPTLDPAVLTGAEVEEWVGAVRARGYDLLPMAALTGPNVRRDLARLHLEVYAHTHRHDPPAAAALAGVDFLGDDLNPAWLWMARRAGQLAGVASIRTTADPAGGELGWFGVTAEHAAEGAALTRALTGLALRAAGADSVREVAAELDSADPNALDLLHALPWHPGRVWLTLVSTPR
ncbi:hypothetical protein DEIPH_ctg051orf0024 [Deinococcus phoenicis]|uniref:N-acetyltransferase domain-containing protein n=1 Tax=Deinococcus phoenicis TaxID=1476583 RepID=A0A016QMB5_9DEIO|nr:GNAT family N-acetyltransferase [Deinococcus phoenicis]EYB67116.1 hypothetical protein DEIPH_ctg051orf0024 [Deinococcus phoenicis]